MVAVADWHLLIPCRLVEHFSYVLILHVPLEPSLTPVPLFFPQQTVLQSLPCLRTKMARKYV